MLFGRPIQSASFPPKNEEKAAGIRIEETTRPWTMDEKEPNFCLNWSITTTEPMMPVSILHSCFMVSELVITLQSYILRQAQDVHTRKESPPWSIEY